MALVCSVLVPLVLPFLLRWYCGSVSGSINSFYGFLF